jgi:hypothetical protein
MMMRMLASLVLATAVIAPPAGLAAPIDAPSAPAATAPDFVQDVVGPYLAIQAALVNDDLKPVAAAAASLQRGATALGTGGNTLAAAAAKTGEARTLEAARASFGELSSALIAYADAAKLPIAGKVVAFCPMADKSWVQAEGAIANPYYGKSMATCGSVTRKLSPTQ